MSNRAGAHGRARTAPVAVIAALSFVGLVGCTPELPEQRPSTSARESTTPSWTTSPTPAPAPTTAGTIAALPDGVKPVRPPALDGPPSPEAAATIAQYFVQLYPYTQTTLDTAEFGALSHPDCAFCASTLSGTENHRMREEHGEGGGISVDAPTVQEVDLGRWFHVTLTMVEEPSRVVNEFGDVVEDNPGQKAYKVDIVVLYEDSRWQIRGVSYEATSPA